MKARTARLGVLLAAVFGLMATMVPSASATTVKTVTFQGTAVLSGGLGYPVLTPPNHREFNFTSDNCVKVSVSVNKTPDKTGPAFCRVTATGTVWGHCGLSNAVGRARLVNTGPVVPGTPGGGKMPTEVMFTFTGVGGVLVITGTETGGGNATVTGEVLAVPVVEVGVRSCLDKTADRFVLAGEITAIDPTP